ncbi:C2 domain-containing protein, partial [Vararia minispora EC-137]
MPGESFDILGTLVVVALKAQNLIDNHTFYKQDPYAVISLNGTTQKTPVDPKGGQHPVWDEEFRFPIPRDIAGKKKMLVISCYSKEKKEDMLLGEGEVDISETLRSGEFDDWVPLKVGDAQRGEIYLEMTFFAAGPAPLNRRKSKFTPQERLARPPQAP